MELLVAFTRSLLKATDSEQDDQLGVLSKSGSREGVEV